MQHFLEVMASDWNDIPDLAHGLRMLVRLSMAVLLGGLLGFEREKLGKPAGLRTHMLVCVGSTLIILSAQQAEIEIGDLSRVIQGVITGIGFIGAGSIIKSSAEGVRGLTTAAGVWVTCGVGIAVGLGLMPTAILGTFFGIVILACLSRLEHYFDAGEEKNA